MKHRGRTLSKSAEDVETRRVGHYTLGEIIGRGGFGVVYHALDMRSGAAVAVKRVNMTKVAQDDLGQIEGEINLLRELDHPNIVRYIDTIRTDTHLNIVLEFIENGSLTKILHSFGGSFTEPLVALFISQVLEGLKYLHSEGVIHRDVKGANILSTKTGNLKLADFGVATHLSENRKSDSVVGTPYWMAPEIIEMSGHMSTACDIWSVGCTAVELLTGSPPYFSLQPMPALFRIVQDEHPPLPPGISPALKDFLEQCFIKEPQLRINAEDLLKHPWLRQNIANASKKGSQMVTNGKVGETKEDAEFVDQTIRISAQTMRAARAAFPQSQTASPASKKDKGKAGGSKLSASSKSRSQQPPASSTSSYLSEVDSDASDGEDKASRQANSRAEGEESGEESEDWDASDDDAGGFDMDSATVRMNGDATAGLPSAGGDGAAGDGFSDESEEEDWDNLSDDDGPAAGAIGAPSTVRMSSGESQPQPQPGAHLVTPARLVRAPSSGGRRSSQKKKSPRHDSADILSPASAGRTKKTDLTAFQESDDDDVENDFDDFDEIDADVVDADKRTAWDKEEDDDSRNVDVFSEAGFDELDTHSNEQAARSAEVLSLIGNLTPKQDPAQVVASCERLLIIFEEDPSQIESVMTTHGVIPIMEMMEVTQEEVLLTILKVVNRIVSGHPRFLQSLCMLGLIPAVYRMVHWRHPMKIRVEAGKFVKQFCSPDKRSKDFTRKMFIACGGLSALVHFLDGEYEHSKELMAMGVDCIYYVFETPNHPKNDFCRLFTKFGLLRPLVLLLRNVSKDSSWRYANDYSRRVANLFLNFSEGDSTIRTTMAKRDVITGLLLLVPELEPDILVPIVKAIHNLSRDIHTLELLENNGVIPVLVPLLASPFSDIQKEATQAMYYMTKINRTRREKAAVHGVIPNLQRIIRKNDALKDFAIPMMCDLAHAGKRTLRELQKNNGVEFYIELLSQSHWHSSALDSLANWLQFDRARVEIVLLQPHNRTKLTNVFKTSGRGFFDSILTPFLAIVKASEKCNRFFGRSEVFIDHLRKHLVESQVAKERRGLLDLLKLLFKRHCQQKDTKVLSFINLLQPVVSKLAKTNQVLVRQQSKKLLEGFAKIMEEGV